METNLTRGNVTGVLVRFALPLFAANLLQSLYSLVDMAVMGRFLGSPGLAALGSSATICYVITSVCAGVTTGGSVLVAQYLGAGGPGRAPGDRREPLLPLPGGSRRRHRPEPCRL